MNIKELSKLTGVNTETIRMYRNSGLLFPEQNPQNGYYDYSPNDFQTLLFIRKLRESNVSLKKIRDTFYEKEMDSALDGYRKELEELDEMIETLRRRRHSLKITLDHLMEYQPNEKNVTVIDARDDKIDCCYEDGINDPVFINWIRNAEFFTQSLCIPGDVLTRCADRWASEDESTGQMDIPGHAEFLGKMERSGNVEFSGQVEIPVKKGLGTYSDILSEQGLTKPEKCTTCPAGKYAAVKVELETGKNLSYSQLAPLFAYIREHHYQITGENTAFLYRIDYSGERPVYIYRLRVRIF